MLKERHAAIYGRVTMERGFCDKCQSMALIQRGRFLCCDSLAGVKSDNDFEIMSQGEHTRKVPPPKDQRRILEQQHNRCIYCKRTFGTMWMRGNKFGFLQLNWDHFQPFSYTQKNFTFVAACQICNGIKSSKMFEDIPEAREYILPQIEIKGYTYGEGIRDCTSLSRLSEAVCD